MRRTRRLSLALAALLLATPAAAHPGSGIVADRQGQIYFLDTGSGLWKLDAHGVLTRIPGPAFHWMTIDPDDRFGKTQLPSGSGWEISRALVKPTLLLASDFPIAVGPDGNLYYPSRGSTVGLDILKTTPSGQTSVLARSPLQYLNGLAAGPDGSLYYTESNAIRRVSAAGRLTTVVEGVSLARCASIPGIDESDRPFFRGLDIDASGTIYVAAAGCGSVLAISPDGKITTLSQVESPWSPTAVVRVGRDLYVLEYLHTATESRRAWLPRVRRLSPDGASRVVATVDRH